MTLKKEASHRLARIAAMLELLGEDPFRVNANARAARTLDAYPGDLDAINDDPAALTKIPGIGKKIAAKIIELHTTGHIEEEDELAARVPQSLLELLEIPGLGPKTVRLLWEQLKVETTDDLARVIEDGSIMELPRMGHKTVDKIRKSLAFMATSSERLALGLAMPVAEAIVERLKAHPDAERVEAAGSIRRGRDTVGDIDILVAATDATGVTEQFVTTPGVTQVLLSGATKSSIRMEVKRSATARKQGAAREIQVDLRVVEPDAWGAALLYFSGSKAHGVRLRNRAQKLGLTLNEYGLFPEDSEDTPPQTRCVQPVASRTEQDIYKKLDLPMIPPEIREDQGELELTQTPRLIEIDDIYAELHAHTTESDGRLSLSELIENAIARGFHTIAVTDHSRSSAQANGLSVERLKAQRNEIDKAREVFAGKITILHGSEVDILADGSLDYDDDTLAWLDLVVASPHVALTQDPATATARLLKAIEHPLVHILGHPTGRLINKRPGLEPAIGELAAAAREHNTALEINAHWMRLDLRDTHVRAATLAGARIAIDCDVHHAADFDNLRYGIATARRGWLEPKDCINAMSKDALEKWMRSKRQ
jgi:DNA polymerase (family X)